MPTVGTTTRLIKADFLLPGHRIVGEIAVANTGLMGLLNDPSTSFTEVLNASVSRIHMPTKLIGEYKVVRLVKGHLAAVCLARREDVGPQALARGGFAHLNTYELMVSTPVYELQGTLEWAGRFDFSTVMVEGTREFIPLYTAETRAILIPTLHINSPAIMFNRNQISSLAIK